MHVNQVAKRAEELAAECTLPSADKVFGYLQAMRDIRRFIAAHPATPPSELVKNARTYEGANWTSVHKLADALENSEARAAKLEAAVKAAQSLLSEEGVRESLSHFNCLFVFDYHVTQAGLEAR